MEVTCYLGVRNTLHRGQRSCQGYSHAALGLLTPHPKVARYSGLNETLHQGRVSWWGRSRDTRAARTLLRGYSRSARRWRSLYSRVTCTPSQGQALLQAYGHFMPRLRLPWATPGFLTLLRGYSHLALPPHTTLRPQVTPDLLTLYTSPHPLPASSITQDWPLPSCGPL